jgi:hypothetical protein
MSNGLFAWYPGCGTIHLPSTPLRNAGPHTLVDEFAELVLKVMSYGYRFDHESGKHDDRCVAAGMAALAAMKEVPKTRFTFSDVFF